MYTELKVQLLKESNISPLSEGWFSTDIIDSVQNRINHGMSTKDAIEWFYAVFKWLDSHTLLNKKGIEEYSIKGIDELTVLSDKLIKFGIGIYNFSKYFATWYDYIIRISDPDHINTKEAIEYFEKQYTLWCKNVSNNNRGTAVVII